MSAVLPRRNTLGLCETKRQDRNGELADGQGLLAARVRLNAVTQWHRRWEYPWMKHGETSGIAGNENMKDVPGMFTHPMLGTHCQIITSHKPPAKN